LRFEVYCDESHPDLLSATNPNAGYMVIGSVWLEATRREEFKREIHGLKNQYRVGGEFKWQKASPSRIDFYSDLVDWFIAKGEDLRFRCIAVEQRKINLHEFHESDQELGFYKFYYQMLQHWILDFNEYRVFCDIKKNREKDRLEILQRCLRYSNLSSAIQDVLAVRSEDSLLIQLADVLTGAASAKLNGTLRPDSTKAKIVESLEYQLGRPIRHTLKSEAKYNVFVINLQGGW